MNLSLIVAVSENGVIGNAGDLPWRLSADLKRFKNITMGNVMLMGRKTWESIGRPLPGRTSVVISRQADYSTGFEETPVAVNVDDALELARQIGGDDSEVFIIGGATIYEMLFPHVDRLLLTHVHAEVEGDIMLPTIHWDDWQLVAEETHPADEKNEFEHTFKIFDRVR